MGCVSPESGCGHRSPPRPEQGGVCQQPLWIYSSLENPLIPLSSPWLLLSIANSRLSQGKPPWVTRGAWGSRGERCREESWLQEQRIYLLYKNYLAEGRSRSACLGKTRQRSFAPGGNSPYCVESGGSVGNWSHELIPSLASSPKAVLVSKNAPAWSSAALQGGTQQWLRVSALGVKAPALLWPQHYPPHAPCSDFEILKPLWGEKVTFLDRLCLLWAWRVECWEEQTGSEGLISECWGCGSHHLPRPPHRTRTRATRQHLLS